MKQPHELPANIKEPDDLGEEGLGHQHHWHFAAIMPHNRKHVLTNESVVMGSVLMTCLCGAQHHSWLIPPPEPQADVQRSVQGGDLSSLGGKPS